VHDLVATACLRDEVDRQAHELDTELGGKVERFVADVDGRFCRFTQVDERQILQAVDGRVDPERAWWWTRIPSRGPIAREIERCYGGPGPVRPGVER
jgi:hypothetical protein